MKHLFIPKMSQTTVQSPVQVDRHQADLLLWCVEQCSIDLSDRELDELETVINTLDGIARS
tara:strand:- start:319 stop:501 length:183 start_codon:yes stop_codon:yes gene_type:complete